MTTLLIDLGNTALKWTIPERSDEPETVVHGGSSRSSHELYEKWLALRPSRVIGCTVASPTLAFSVTKFFNDHKLPWEWVRAQASYETDDFVLVNDYERPSQLGADRWYAAIGAIRQWPGKSLLVVHAGTATTVDSIVCESEKRYTFKGGRIAPGPTLMHKALLNAVPTLDNHLTEAHAFPRCTADAITTGIVDAQNGLICRALDDMRHNGFDPVVVLAGGAAGFLHASLKELIPNLYLRHNLVLGGLADKAGRNESL